MSARKPETPGHESTDNKPNPLDHPAGRRFVSDTVQGIERELVEDGADLPNRGIPTGYRDRVEDCEDVAELRELVETEVQKPHPNQSLIGYVQARIAEVSADD